MFYPPPIESQFPANISGVNRRLNKLESIVSAKADSSSLSRVGANLITNGTGLLGSNKNFSDFEFDGTELYGGVGSFKSPTQFTTLFGDEYIPVDAPASYYMEMYARNGASNASEYVTGSCFSTGFACYDADENLISDEMFRKFVGSTDTTLAADLNPGDSTITLTDATGWSIGSDPYTRQITWFGYTNSLGRTYPDYTYSRTASAAYRNYADNGCWGASGISGNTVTLTEPWPSEFGSLTAGTAVRNSVTSDDYYLLFVADTQTCPNEWTRFDGEIGSYNTDGIDDHTLFPYGTAFIKPVFIVNQVETGAAWYFNLLSLKKSSSSTYRGYGTVRGFTFADIQSAIDTATSGDTIIIPPGTYVDNGFGQIQLNKSLKLVGYGAVLNQTTSNTGIINLTVGSVTIEGIEFKGPQYAVYTGHSGETCIKSTNAYTSWIYDVAINHCTFHNVGYSPVWLQYVDRFEFCFNHLYNYCRAGLVTISALHGKAIGNHIHDLNFPSGTVNQYGFQFSRDQTKTITDSPRSAHIVCSGNIVEDSAWEGIDTHAGANITVTGNIVRNCEVGIAIVGCPDETNTDRYGPQNVTVTGNVIDSTVSDGTKKAGIQFVGPTPGGAGDNVDPGTGSITGNVVIGHGDETNSLSGGIQFYGTRGLVVSGNTVKRCANAGIIGYHTNDDFAITGNTVIDPWTNNDSNNTSVGIWIRSTNQSGQITGNTMLRGSLSGKSHIFNWGIFSASSSTNDLTVGTNRVKGATTGEVSIGALTGSRQPVYARDLVLKQGGLGGIDDFVCGDVMLNGTTAVVINTTAIKDNSMVFLTPQPYGTTPTTPPVGIPYVWTRVDSSYFSIKSTSASDTSVLCGWLIVNKIAS